MQRGLEYPQGIDVYNWPEFKALMLRLGMDYTAPVREVTLFIPLGGYTELTVKTLCNDQPAKRPS